MFALVEIKGKQYRVEKDTVLKVDLLNEDLGTAIEFNTVLLCSQEGESQVGAPYVEGATVKATVSDSFKDKKIKIFNYKRRKGYRRTHGHRQRYTYLKIDDIVTS